MLVESREGVEEPLVQYSDFKYVPWPEIYPRYKGPINETEIKFLTNLVQELRAKRLLDLAVGGGGGLAAYLSQLKKEGYELEAADANEVDPAFVELARKLFEKERHEVTIHRADWNGMDNAEPPYTEPADLAYVEGSSLTYVGGDTREENKSEQKSAIASFADRIEEGGTLLVDTRDYDYIAMIVREAGDSPEKLKEAFTFTPNVFYQGAQKEVTILPVYIDETRICFHYYDIEEKKWALLKLFRVYPEELKESLLEHFDTVEVYRDFKPEAEKGDEKTAFIQYVAKGKR